MKKGKVKEFIVDAKITPFGMRIHVNKDHFDIKYPEEIWKAYPDDLKKILVDNIAYSSTIFLPQMHDLDRITYKTARPLGETFFFKNAIYDMPICAAVDEVSSQEYIRKFYNTIPLFADEVVKKPVKMNFPKSGKRKTAIIPFSFGKESLLTFALCRELGIEPILVNFVEPAHAYEHHHKKQLIQEIGKDLGVKVHVVENGPGIFRYGTFWNLNTELGWGLHTTDYVMLTLPFAHYYDSHMLFLGNEHSCNDIFIDPFNVLTFKAGYDQYKDWTPQQGLLASMLWGNNMDVYSLVEPIYEIAEAKILHTRYSEIGKYQMSCFAIDKEAATKRWCENCVKCSYMYVICSAFGIDTKKVGFTKNMLSKEYDKLFDYFFKYDMNNPAYGSQEELALGFYLIAQRGDERDIVKKYIKNIYPHYTKKMKRLKENYLGIHETSNIPEEYKKALMKILHEELEKI